MYLINSLPKLSNLFNCALLGYNLEGEFLECRNGGGGGGNENMKSNLIIYVSETEGEVGKKG